MWCSPTLPYSRRSTCRNAFPSAISADGDEPRRCRRYVPVSIEIAEVIVSVIVIEFVTLDGVVSDPDGSGGTPAGGWAFRHGRQEVAGDKFRLGSTLDDGVLLLGRATWQLFSGLWPGRDDPFAARMNAVPKLVVSRTLGDCSAWVNSQIIDGSLVDAVRSEKRDVVVAGSLSVVHELAAADLIDEYRLLTFPTVVGTGERLFRAGGPAAQLECLSAEQTGAAVLTRYVRPRRAG
jgi:dihydrofolate reductase